MTHSLVARSRDRPGLRIGLFFPKAIGDLLFVLPTLHAFRSGLPEAHLTLVVKDKQAPLARNLEGPVVDRLLVLEGTSRSSRRTVIEGLRDDSVDVLIDLAGTDKAGLLLISRFLRRRDLFMPAGADCRGQRWIYTPLAQRLPAAGPAVHRVEQYRLAAGFFGLDPIPVSFDLCLPDRARAAGEETVEALALQDGPVVALNVGASRPGKRWPVASVERLGRRLAASGIRVVLTGSADFSADGRFDRELAIELEQQGFFDGETRIDLIRRPLPAEVSQLEHDAWLLRYSGVFGLVVGFDTGPMHIAGSVGADAARRTLSLFGPTSPWRYAPYDPSRDAESLEGRYNTVLRPRRPCLPGSDRQYCRHYDSRRCRECMASLLPEAAAERALSMLRHGGRPPATA